jgi:hypothetical protein
MGSASAELFFWECFDGGTFTTRSAEEDDAATTSGRFPATIASFMIRGNFLAHKNVVVVCC